MAVYVMIPVKPKTKKLVDAKKEASGASSYDEVITDAFKPRSAWEILSPHIGMLKDAPPFERDKSERTFD